MSMRLAFDAHSVIAKVKETDLQQEAERLERERLERQSLRRQRKTTTVSASELLQKLSEKAGIAKEPEEHMQVRSQDAPPEPKPATGGPPAFPPPPKGKEDVIDK